MQTALDQMSWKEVETYLQASDTIILPVGSTEQHGPMGLIGTDTFCAQSIAAAAAKIAGVLVAPALAYTPAPFNTAFPGTVSLSAGVFTQMVTEILQGLGAQGFGHIYILNGHGANIAPMKQAVAALETSTVHLRSWWEFKAVQALREKYYGDWEGMHATPSEVAITQAFYRILPSGEASAPPQKLSPAYIQAHAGDRHGPPAKHRAAFPDGRVGSHSALARPEQGLKIDAAAAKAAAADIAAFSGS